MEILCAPAQIHEEPATPGGGGPGISAFKASLGILMTNHIWKNHFSVVVLNLFRVIGPFEMLRRLRLS